MLVLILQSIQKRKKKLALIVIQFIIGFCSLLFSMCTIENLLQYKENVERLAPLDTYHIYMDYDIGDISQESIKRFESIIDLLKSDKSIEQVGIFERKEMYITNQTKADVQVSVMMANNDLLKINKFIMSSGSCDELLGYNDKDKIIPVVISSGLEKEYIVGNTYEFIEFVNQGEEEKVTFKVVGVLSPSVKYWQGGSNMITETISDKFEFIIAPKYKEFSSIIPYTTNVLIRLSEENGKANAVKSIDKIYEKEELNIEAHRLDEEVEKYYSRQRVIVVATIAFALIILFLSILGCIGTILSSIVSRKKEFGIYFSLGVSKKHLIYLVCGEVLILFLFSFLLASILSTGLIQMFLSEEGFAITIRVIGVSFGSMFVCALLCVLAPLRKMLSLQPVDLLYEREQ